jgi:class 3 adenylate cyclase/tetratricopeptide (TPR) repeat protein
MNCGSCGADNPAGSRFCSTCGHPLITRADERRVATVVFADLVGFTTLSESRDPEQVKNLVDRCFERLATDVTDFGGQVDKILGDAIVALFGAPIAHEDDAERAVRAALRMQESLASFQENAEIVVQMRVGVNTGEVLVGSLRAGGEYTAMGDVVNIAQRLQSSAKPGTVVVGPATYAATRRAIEYHPLGELLAKGREEPVGAWAALQPLLPPGYRRRRQETSLIGRDPEMAVLSHIIDAAVARKRANLVLLVGDAGVGKSRLSEEAARRARTKHHALVLDGRCVPYGEANVWWPVAEALRQGCAISADDPLELATEKAQRAVAAVVDDVQGSVEVSRIVKGLLFLMGYEVMLREIDPLRAREEALRSVLRFVEASAVHRPVVLTVSDLHWADDLVLETMAALLDRLRGTPFILLATARKEIHDRWTMPASRHNSIVINLDPLDRGATDTLLAALVDHDLSPVLREALLDRSGGNPFFLEELVALLADSESRTDEPALRGTGFLSELPDTLRGLVAARLDSLTPDERATLEDAAVFGRTGPIEAIERMAHSIHGLAEVRPLLADLADKEILVVSGERWSFPSDLIREVAYATLTKADRARRHHGIAAFVESTQADRHAAPDRTVDVIAFHYGASAELINEIGRVDGVPGDVVSRAFEWIEEAAQRAEVSQALPVLVRLYGQAARLAGPTPDERLVAYLLGRATAETELRLLDEARADIDEALSLAQSLDRPALVARGTLALGEFEQKGGALDNSLVTVHLAIEQFRQLGDLKGTADGLRVMGMTHIFRGAYAEADVCIGAALDASRQLQDRRGEAWALQNLAWISYIEGRADEAEIRLNESAQTFEELGDSGGLGWALGLLAFVRFHQGQLDEAEQLGEQILDEARARGDRWGEAMMLLLNASVRLWSGRSSEGALAAREALSVFDSMDDLFGQSQAQAMLGRALVTSGRVEEGLTVMSEALDHHSVLEDVDKPDQARVLLGVGLAGAAVQIGDAQLALRAVGGGNVPDFEPDTIGHADGVVAEALALLQDGQIEAAFERILPFIDREGLPAPSPYAQSVLALALAASGRPEGVAELADQVIGAARSTYLDRVNARLAVLLVRARAGDRTVVADFAALAADTDSVDDAVAQAVVRLAAAQAFTANDWSESASAWENADVRLGALGIRAEGWRRLFGLAVAANEPAPVPAE